jgi:putative transposase
MGIETMNHAVRLKRLLAGQRGLRRALVRAGEGGYYHVVSRVHGREYLLSDEKREMFRDLLRRVAGFCGVDVLTFCFMENHFHLLIHVPGKPGDLEDEELLRRARLIYPKGEGIGRQPLSLELIEWALQSGKPEDRMAMRALLMRRMASLPVFVKMLKQRFSIRYNREEGHVGTLWEGPFRSVLVEPSRRALSVVGAYIDLNPVRAGIVSDPKDFRFSGYGEACGQGAPENHRLIRHIVELGLAGDSDKAAAAEAAAYRRMLFVRGVAGTKSGGARTNEGAAQAVVARGGQLSLPELLRCRVRYFTHGVVIGSRAFIEKWAKGEPLRDRLRDRSPPPLRGGDWEDLCALRDLQKL